MTLIEHTAANNLISAFPSRLHSTATRVIAELPPARYAPVGGFNVMIDNETIVIPSRIYNSIPTDSHSDEQKLVTTCIYSRHYDGFIREQQLNDLLQMDDECVPPYVLQLLGEYILEIIQVMNANRSVMARTHYTKFMNNNPTFVERTKSRIISYWNCYYRNEYPRIKEYPGYLVAESLGWWDAHKGRR